MRTFNRRGLQHAPRAILAQGDIEIDSTHDVKLVPFDLEAVGCPWCHVSA